jgi:hypothetical protein
MSFSRADGAQAYDARFKRLLRRPDCVVINNYKCGFSSSNLLESQTVLRIAPEDTVILFYRQSFLRVVSTFINWCITDERYKHQDGWLLANIRDAVGDADYAQFLHCLGNDQMREAFELYLSVLRSIYMKNNHTLPQCAILEYYGIATVHHLVDLESSARFYDITKIQFPFDAGNRSDRAVKDALLALLRDKGALQAEIRDIYQADIDYFARKNVLIDQW